jgi:hypothetical protein
VNHTGPVVLLHQTDTQTFQAQHSYRDVVVLSESEVGPWAREGSDCNLWRQRP